MGWLISYDLSKEQQVAELVAGWEKEGKGTKCLAQSLRGNKLWAVFQPFEVGKPEAIEDRYIVVFLLRKDRGMGWGYKDVSESMGPCEVNCPLKFLKMVPTVPTPYGEGWREKVRAHHAARKTKTKIEVGDTLRFKQGISVLGEPLVEGVVTRKQGRGYLVAHGHSNVKVFTRHVAEVVKP